MFNPNRQYQITYSSLTVALLRAGRLAIVLAPAETTRRFLVTVAIEDTVISGTAATMPEAIGIVETAVSRMVAGYFCDMEMVGYAAVLDAADYFGVDVTDAAAMNQLRQAAGTAVCTGTDREVMPARI